MFDRIYLAPLALAGVLLGTSVGAFAQAAAPIAPATSATSGSAMNGHHRHHHRGWRAALDSLTLSPDQKTKIDATVRADRQAFRAGGSEQTPEARRAAGAKMRADVESVLTPDQKTQFEATLKANRAHATTPGA